MTASAMRAYRFRWWLLIVATLCLLAGLSWLVSPLLTTDFANDGHLLPTMLLPTSAVFAAREDLETKLDYALTLVLFLGVLLLTQWMFLRPRRIWTVRLAEESRPLKSAMVAAAFMAMMLTVGMVATFMELIAPEVWLLDSDWVLWPGVLLGTTALWAAWGIAFYLHARDGDRVTQLQKTTHALIAGSVLELFVAIGVFVWNPQDEDCWCARGSYTGLVFAATVMIWAFGPGLVLLFVKVRGRRVSSSRS